MTTAVKTLAADGYTWDGSTSTLTLKNIIINVPRNSSTYLYNLYGLQLPANATVKLEGINIVNTSSAEFANYNSYAVYGAGALTIENNGAAIGTLYALAGKVSTGNAAELLLLI